MPDQFSKMFRRAKLYFFDNACIRSALMNNESVHVSKVSLHYITCQVNIKPAVIILPTVVNALVATFLRGDEDL